MSEIMNDEAYCITCKTVTPLKSGYVVGISEWPRKKDPSKVIRRHNKSGICAVCEKKVTYIISAKKAEEIKAELA